jgi:hypothetical protein
MSDSDRTRDRSDRNTAHDEPLRRSVEAEYWVIDDEGRLCEPEGLLGESAGVEREFVEPLLEVKTSPCSTTAELREELFARLGAVLERAAERDMGLVPLGTPLAAGEIADLPSERTRIQDRVVGSDFEYVRHCAGTHVHFEQRPGHEAEQFNTLVALDPALALVNSSPYFGGEEVAAGARSELYRRRAYAGLAHQGRLWRYADDRAEWTRRLERRYEEFVREAIEAGIDRRTVATHFDPGSAVWTPVQLREAFATVEWRSPDTALPSRIVRLADDMAGVVERVGHAEVRIGEGEGSVSEGLIDLPPFGTVLERIDGAIEDGLESDAVCAYLDRMGFDTDAYDPVSRELAGSGELTPEDARRLRTEHAQRLARDVRAGPIDA